MFLVDHWLRLRPPKKGSVFQWTLKVDTERYPRLASQYNVRGIPNFAVFSRGQLQFQQAGLVDASQH